MSPYVLVLLAAFLAAAPKPAAQAVSEPEPSPQAIEPDRPDITNGARLVGVGDVQIEAGGLFTHAGDSQNAFGSPVTVRIGLTDWLEARIGNDGVLTAIDGITRQTGVGNTQIGAKLKLLASPGGTPILSILPSVNLPTADPHKGFGSGDADYTIALLTGTDVGPLWHVDANYGVGAIGSGDDRSRFAQHLASVSASVAASDRLNPYVEGYWFSRMDIDGDLLSAVDGGFVYTIGLRMAVDGGIQVSRTGGENQVAAFGGFSMIVGHRNGSGTRQARASRMHMLAAAGR